MDSQFHKEITEKVCNILIKSYQLNNGQLDTIIRANLNSDNNQNNSAIHFDNCTFLEGSRRIQRLYLNYGGQKDLFSIKSLTALGKVLHSVQDFYSHSNWIELFQLDKNLPIWDLRISSLPSKIVSGYCSESKPNRCISLSLTHEVLNKDNAKSISGQKVVFVGPHIKKTLFQLTYEVSLEASWIELNKFLLA